MCHFLEGDCRRNKKGAKTCVSPGGNKDFAAQSRCGIPELSLFIFLDERSARKVKAFVRLAKIR